MVVLPLFILLIPSGKKCVALQQPLILDIPMKEKVTIGVPCTPAISTKLECLGERTEVVLNENGGMGGSKILLYGKEYGSGSRYGMTLTESKRQISLNLKFISRSEKVQLWKQTHEHNNPSCKGTIINYFATRGGVELEQSDQYLGLLSNIGQQSIKVKQVLESVC